MANKKEEAKNVAENEELNDLLDSALKDFDILSKPKEADKPDSQKPSDKGETSETTEAKDETENEWTEEFIKQTIEQMDTNLQNILQDGGNELTDLKSILQKLEQVSPTTDGEGQTSGGVDFESIISQALKTMSAPGPMFPPGGNLQNETDYITNMFGQTSLDGDGTGILSFIQGMMQQLLSKEMLYPSLKEISEKYPAWLEEHKATLSPSDLQRYTKQSELLQKVCTELEKEKEDDAKDVQQSRFESIMSLMQEMEQFGRLPVELASTLLQSDLGGEGSFLDGLNSMLCENV